MDVGGATGYVARALRERGCRLTGIEIDAEAAAVAEPNYERMIVGDIERMDLDTLFGDQRFDVVIFGDVLEHLVDPEATLVKVAQILAVGGSVVASIPNVAHGSVRLALLAGTFEYRELGLLDRTHLRFFDKAGVAALFRNSGYKVSAWRHIRLDPFATEITLDPNDYPPHLIDAVRQDDQAHIYQYVVKASLDPVGTKPQRRPARNGTGRQRTANTVLKQLLIDERARFDEEIAAANRRIDESEDDLVDLRARYQEQENYVRALERQVREITGSTGYRLLRPVRATIDWVAPPASRRRTTIKAGKAIVAGLRREGPAWILRRATRPGDWPRMLRRLDSGAASIADLNEQYREWIRRHTPGQADLEALRKSARDLTYRPLVSIVTPVYNPEISWLRDTMDSVRNQVYNNWEFCLADDCSTRPGVREVLQEYADRDPRIKLNLLDENQGIAGASNAALSLATGEFVGLLDHDDQLRPQALYEVVTLLGRDRQIDFVYSDEDKLDEEGNLIDPFFKPDWSPETLMSLNYVTHFAVYRKTLLNEIGGFRLGYDGSQDYDLALRATERARKVGHVKYPIYTWRMVPGSAAASIEAKPYAYEAAKAALSDALERRGISGIVEDGQFVGSYRIRSSIDPAARVSIVIPTRDRVDLLRRCIASIERRSTFKNYEIVVIDNDSVEPATHKYLSRINARVIKSTGRFNFSRLVNLGAAEADGEYLLFLNNDTEVISRDWLEALLEGAQNPEVGPVGAALSFPDGTPQHQGIVVGMAGPAANVECNDYFGLGRVIRNVSAVTAACMMVRREVFEALGGFDEEMAVAYNDVDFCLRALESGYRVVYTPFASLYHHESATRGKLSPTENASLFEERWINDRDYEDPYYNPNLDLNRPYNIEV